MPLKTTYVNGDVVTAADLNTANTLLNSVTPTGSATTGTPSSSTFLRGDGAWAAPTGGVTTGKAIAMAMVFG